MLVLLLLIGAASIGAPSGRRYGLDLGPESRLFRQEDPMRIGQLAREAGITVDAVRFYERRGVLPAPERLSSGYRVYTPATLERLRFVRSLQELGFTLEEIADGLRVVERGGATCQDQRWRGERVVARLDARIAELGQMRARVASALEACSASHCPVVDAAVPISRSLQSK
jgi:DNA-binding transcriptional MerR regulator